MNWFKFTAKYFLILMVCVSVQPVHAAPAKSTEGVRAFIDSVSKSTISVISNDALSDKQKEDKLDDLFKKSVDVQWIGRFVVGKYWRGLTNEQKADYMELYSEYLVNSYVPNFKKYNQDQLEIVAVKPGDTNEFLVDTFILRENDQHIRVSYNVRFAPEKNQYMVFDIIAEGVSLIVTQRSEFGSILQNNGIEYLNNQLEEKLKLANNSRK
jgi:phospholipid transport system substrate-binding protein